MSALASVRQLSVRYQGTEALSGINGQFERGGLYAVVGANGAGKSTLLKAILGLVPLAGGTVELHLPRARIAYLPQQCEIERGFPMLARDCVLLGAWQRVGLLARVPADLQARVDQALAAVGMAQLAQRPIGALSAGQFQRLLFARLMVQDAELLLLDEPFNAIDAATTTLLLSLIHEWHEQGRTVVAVLHDHAQVRAHFPQAVLLARRLLAWGDTQHVLGADHLARARDDG